eukprot:CAMPEP_0197682648 /NCGR_PEP_ID=MMETSP1338-20131121/96791_1 /TAXON_ID=43686 ORGANISM="Pelagodinium beii, Strain RCC1491" /NCGR_SAMPLE_ID=MMETSP1338 /ASSEMBLY_ACC=CAM_ASM_000754 /LENGTH=242 /DNA_ID=CAMNT_0043264135 /DNA_START=61 /DNA_END=785 /DNA_ORIENTATION=+
MIRRVLYEVGRAFRETGQQLDRVGLRVVDKPIFKEPFSRHRAVFNLFDKHPTVEPNVFVAPNASVVGRVTILHKSTVWYNAVIRGDFNDVEIGGFTSIGEGAVVNTSKSEERTPDNATRIGDYVTVGAGAVLQSCTVESHAVIGAGAVVMDGAIVENHSHVGPGSVVHPDQRVPSGQLWAGNPAKFVRNLTPEEKASFEIEAEAVAETAEEHADVFLEHGAAYLEAESRYASVVDKLESGDA